MKCLNCGNEVSSNAVFCDNCGRPIEVPPGAAPETDKQETPKSYCGSCGAELETGAEFCGNCGARMGGAAAAPSSRVFCGSCGAELEAGAEFCGNCGAAAGSGAFYGEGYIIEEKKSKLPGVIAALILIIVFLGAFFAGYKFYLSRIDDDGANGTAFVSEQAQNGNEQGRGETAASAAPSPSASAAPSPTPTAAPAPVFTSVTASSTRGTDTEGGQYSAEAVLSDDPTTKWVPLKGSSNGIGEWIQINASDAQHVNGIEILNGYHKNAETWGNNNRVKSCTLSFSDGQSKTVTLDDSMGLIKIDLDSPVNTTYIRLTINSIYHGAKWNDTAVTYLGAY